MKRALIIGALGQDGHYLTELLLGRGYQVVGTTHRPLDRAALAYAGELRALDLADSEQVHALVAGLQPDEIYNLGARASSAQLFDDAVASGDINGLGCARLLAAIERSSPATRLCQALSSEVFAGGGCSPQNEETPLAPCNAYGAAKAYAMHMVQAYRGQRGVFACGALLYNHESPLRPAHFLSRKISLAVARIVLGLDAEPLQLGPAEHRRDWGHARDHVRAMHLMLQHPAPEDFVVATGVTHRVADFCETAFASVGLDYRQHVVFAPQAERRRESCELRGDPAKARALLGWTPDISWEAMVAEMVEADIRLLRATV